MILDASDFIAPVGYSWWWSAIGITLLVLIAAWFLAAWLFTRARKQRTMVAPPVPSFASFEPLRNQYLRRIDAIEAEWRAQTIDSRAAGQRLSTTMREYVDAVSGTATETMTLTDLQLQRFDGLGQAVAGLYPIAFPERSNGDLAAGLEAARRVVSTWK